MKRQTLAVTGLATAALLLTACAGGAPAPTSGGDAAPTELRIGNFIDLTSWDPAIADIGFNAPYLSAVYDPLVAIDGTGEPQPALATDWEYSDDFTLLTMNLRSDATFSDGAAFDAEAAVANLEYLRAGTISREAYLNVDRVTAVDEDTIEIHLTARDDRLLYFMGLGRSYMAAPEAIAAGTLAEAPVGSGPYLLSADTVPGSEYRFEKVADHWAGAQFPFGRVSVLPMQDPTARNNALEAGQIDVSYGDATTIAMAEDNGWNVAAQTASWVGLRINDHTGSVLEPLGDVRVRQALNYAFDGQALLDSVGEGQGTATNQLFAAGFPGNDPKLDDRYAHDIDRAKALLAEAGYGDGFAVTLPMAPPFQPWQPAVEQVFGDLGITVSWDEFQYADYQSNAPNYPMFIAVLAVDSNPAATIARQLTVPQWYMPSPDIAEFPKLQAQVDAALAAAPGVEQDAEIRTLNELVTEDAWHVVWYQSDNIYVSVPGVTVEPVTGMMFPALRQIQPES
ncbi:ABC transporter substrate-binding protein [Leucobacter luti]|uniref:Peptide/nickel transport system substrate-binding protein n=1 Tax=Leucobacter luti TaxID=340320 RepID=A0A4Q7U571_9MICO|nr:ABC transporter substrate-binding protein [Leucobacter luti]MBL3700994.1 hypothetical protein [Leucobacter luti]RZT68785.1 peptide/nickel transport system substrate-binding protein [Leucobacter luti]